MRQAVRTAHVNIIDYVHLAKKLVVKSGQRAGADVTTSYDLSSGHWVMSSLHKGRQLQHYWNIWMLRFKLLFVIIYRVNTLSMVVQHSTLLTTIYVFSCTYKKGRGFFCQNLFVFIFQTNVGQRILVFRFVLLLLPSVLEKIAFKRNCWQLSVWNLKCFR